MRDDLDARLLDGIVIPALPLVLDSNRKFNEEGQRKLLRYYLEAGVGGVAIAVHTTQFEIRKPDIALFAPILKLAGEEISAFEKRTGRPIMRVAGVCGKRKQAVAEAELAKSLGYDAALLSPGGLSYLTEQELMERTVAVAEVLPVIGFYLQPAVGGRVFSYHYWEELCKIKNVIAIKCAAFNRYLTLDVIRAVALSKRKDEIALYTGNDDNIVIDLLTKYSFHADGKLVEKGFSGGLLGHWAVWAHSAVTLLETLKQARGQDEIPAGLLTLASQITDANGAFFDAANGFKGCIAGIHEVLRRQGLMDGIWCLDEAETLSPGQAEEIARVYRMYPHLNDDAFVKKFVKKIV